MNDPIWRWDEKEMTTVLMSGRALFGNVEGVLSVTEDSIMVETPSGINGIERSALRMVKVAADSEEILVAYANGPKVESIKVKPLEGSVQDWMFALEKNVPKEYFVSKFERMFQRAKKGLMEYKKMTDIPIRKLNECTTPVSKDRFARVTEWRNVGSGACEDNADVKFWREMTNLVWADMYEYYWNQYLKDAPPVHPAGWDEEDPHYTVGRSTLDDFYDAFELPEERRAMLGKLLLVQYLWKLRRAESGFAEDSIGVPWEDYGNLWPDDYEKYFIALGVLDAPVATEEMLAKIRAKGRVDDLRNTADPKQLHFKERVAKVLETR